MIENSMVSEPIPGRDCPRVNDVEQCKITNCSKVDFCEKEYHDTDDCFLNCRLCETELQAHCEGD